MRTGCGPSLDRRWWLSRCFCERHGKPGTLNLADLPRVADTRTAAPILLPIPVPDGRQKAALPAAAAPSHQTQTFCSRAMGLTAVQPMAIAREQPPRRPAGLPFPPKSFSSLLQFVAV